MATPSQQLTDTRTPQYQALKGKIHQDLLNRLNLDRLTQTARADAEPEIRSVIQDLLDRENQRVPLSLYERESLVGDVLNELFGLGPLEALLKDPTVSDILVNKSSQVYVERNGRLEHTVNVIIPPLALDGPSMSIRRFRTDKLGAQDLVERESLTQPMLDFLKAAVGARLNILVSGGTGAGKTTLLNILSSFISDRERIVTIEDAAELVLRQRHVVRLETRPANIEGKGMVKQRQLVIN